MDRRAIRPFGLLHPTELWRCASDVSLRSEKKEANFFVLTASRLAPVPRGTANNRPLTSKLVSANHDRDVRRNEGETPLVVSPSFFFEKIHPFRALSNDKGVSRSAEREEGLRAPPPAAAPCRLRVFAVRQQNFSARTTTA